MTTHRDEIEQRILPRVAKPNRYIGNYQSTDTRLEPRGSTAAATDSNARFEEADVRVLVIHPDLFEAGFHDDLAETAASLIGGIPGSLADRAFLPWPDLRDALAGRGAARDGAPGGAGGVGPRLLWGLETFRPAADFDLILFTPRAPLQFVSVLRILELCGLALRAVDRPSTAPLTLLLGKGVANPAPLAPAFDLVGYGAPEVLLPSLIESLRGLRGAPRASRRDALARHASILAAERLVGDAGQEEMKRAPRVRAVLPADWDTLDPMCPSIPLVEVDFDAFPLILRRGGRALRFRGDPENWLPAWNIQPERAFSLVEAGLRRLGVERVELVGDAPADHPTLGRIVEGLVRRHPGVRIQLDDFGLDQPDPALARELLRGKRATFSWSPWAGSTRLRQFLNVELDEARFLEAVATALRGGCHLLKLRFGVGWPTETADDIEALCDLVQRVRALGGQGGSPPRIQIQIEPFLPEPHSPFQWDSMLPWPELADRLAFLRRRLEQGPVQLRHAPLEQLQLEASLLRGDSRLFATLEEALRRDASPGQPGEAWDPSRWLSAWAATGTSLDEAVAARAPAAPLPWDAIELALSREDLLVERGRAAAGQPADIAALVRAAEVVVVRQPLAQAPPTAVETPPDVEARAFGRRGRRRTGSSPSLSAARFRLHFAKEASVRFTAHLDVGRWFERALRRLDLSVGGGRQRSFKLSFGPPLPLGMTGEDEYLDVQFAEDVSESFLDGVGSFLPPGCRLLDTKAVRSSVESLSQAIDLAEYRIQLPPALVEALPEPRRAGFLSRLEPAMAAALAATEIPVTRGADGPLINMRPALLAATLGLTAAGGPCLNLKLQLTAPGGGRPEMLLPALCGEPELDPRLARIHRVSLRISGAGREFTPLQVVEPGFPWWRDTLRRQPVAGRP